MIKNKKILILTSLLVLATGCRSSSKEDLRASQTRETSDYLEVSEVETEKELETEPKETESEEIEEDIVRDPSILNDEIMAYLEARGIDPSLLGFAYVNLEDGTSYDHNGDEIFLAASTSKVPIVMFLFDLAHEEGLDLETTLTVGANHMEEGTGTIYYESGPGASYSIYELAELMISASDNTATNMIYGYLTDYNGEYLLHSLARIYGLSTGQDNYMTPNEAINILERIYFNEEANPLYHDLLSFMENTIYNDYYTSNIPEEKIAHKTGDLEGYFNDIGIVYSDKGPYAFAAYTDNIAGATEVLSDLGSLVHSWHEGQNPAKD